MGKRREEAGETEPAPEKEYTSLLVRHILADSEETLDDALARVKELEAAALKRRQKPHTALLNAFAAVAKKSSACSSGKKKGGSLGWNKRGGFTPKFEREIWKAGVMEMTRPFETEQGWHVALVEDRK